MFAAPNTALIMTGVPARAARRRLRHALAPFQNSGTALSIGVFFSLMVAGPGRPPCRRP